MAQLLNVMYVLLLPYNVLIVMCLTLAKAVLIPFGAPAHHWLNISFVNSIAWLQYGDIVLAS